MDLLKKQELQALATHCGFDYPQELDDDWLSFMNTNNQNRVWLSVREDGYLVGVESPSAFKKLMPDHRPAFCDVKPVGAYDCLCIQTFEKLSQILWQLSEWSPTPFDEYIDKTAALPRTTEAECQVIERVGQDIYRNALIHYWNGQCAVTGLAIPALLRASHIKPWADANDRERLDVYNGFLLSPNLDLCFDQGFITFDDDGKIVFSPNLTEDDKHKLGLNDAMSLHLEPRHLPYLAYHRAHVFLRCPIP